MRRWNAIVVVVTTVLWGRAVVAGEGTGEKPSGNGDDTLMKELEAAAASDEVSRNKGAETSVMGADREAEDPMNVLGKGVSGSEMNPSISLILDMVGAYFSEEERIRQEGHSPSAAGPSVQSLEGAFQASVDPYFRFFMAYGFSDGEVEEGYAVTTSLPWNLQVRAGKFLSNVGRHNPTHLHQWHFATGPLPNEYLFGGEGMTLPGVELSVLMPLPWYVEAIGALQSGESGAFGEETENDPNLKDFVYPVRLVQFFDLSDDWSLQVGANTVQGRSAPGGETGGRTSVYGGDVFFKWRPIGQGETGYKYIAWTLEGWYRKAEVQLDTWKDFGGYGSMVFGLGKQWEAGVRGEVWRRFDSEGSEERSLEDRLPFGVNTARLSVSGGYLPSHFSLLRLQYTVEDTEVYELNHIGLIQLEVSAGAHGSHGY